MRYTEYHAGKAVIKDKELLPDAMEKLAKLEDAEENECKGCRYDGLFRQMFYSSQVGCCANCVRNLKDNYRPYETNEPMPEK